MINCFVVYTPEQQLPKTLQCSCVRCHICRGTGPNLFQVNNLPVCSTMYSHPKSCGFPTPLLVGLSRNHVVGSRVFCGTFSNFQFDVSLALCIIQFFKVWTSSTRCTCVLCYESLDYNSVLRLFHQYLEEE